MLDPVFPVLSGLAFALLLLPLPFQLQSRNLALILYVLWLTVFICIYFVNSVIWANTVADLAPVWCDIATKISVGAQFALPATALAVLRKLERIASTRHANLSESEIKWDRIFDLTMGVFAPVIYMVLHVVVQGHRYDILEESGCIYTVYRCWAMLFLFTLPPLCVSLGAIVYAALSIRWFALRRRQFQAVLQSRSVGLSTSRYIRILVLTSTEIFFNFPAQVLNAVNILSSDGDPETDFPRPYPSWAYVHADFNEIDVASPEDLWLYDRRYYVTYQFLRYVIVLSAFAAFFCLGCTQDNIQQWRVFSSRVKKFFRKHVQSRRRKAPLQQSPNVSGGVSVVEELSKDAVMAHYSAPDLDVEKGASPTSLEMKCLPRASSGEESTSESWEPSYS